MPPTDNSPSKTPSPPSPLTPDWLPMVTGLRLQFWPFFPLVVLAPKSTTFLPAAGLLPLMVLFAGVIATWVGIGFCLRAPVRRRVRVWLGAALTGSLLYWLTIILLSAVGTGTTNFSGELPRMVRTANLVALVVGWVGIAAFAFEIAPTTRNSFTKTATRLWCWLVFFSALCSAVPIFAFYYNPTVPFSGGMYGTPGGVLFHRILKGSMAVMPYVFIAVNVFYPFVLFRLFRGLDKQMQTPLPFAEAVMADADAAVEPPASA